MNNTAIPVLTIDGPSGAGKGTVAQMLALDLGWNILDSGALYRTLAYYFDKEGLEPEDLVALTLEAAAMAKVPLAGTDWIPGARKDK